MAQLRKVGVGELLRATLEELADHRRTVGVYLAVFVPLTAAANFGDMAFGLVSEPDGNLLSARAGFSNGLFGLLAALASVAGQYMAFERMLGGHGHGGGRIVAFIGLAIITFLGVTLSAIFFLFPGLFVGARWLMSPAIFAGEGRGVFESLSESWRQTRGNTVPVALTLFLVLLLFVVFASLLSPAKDVLGIAIVDAIAGEIWAVLLISLSVATYRALASPTSELVETFA